jgi:hypothetical protein
MHSDITYIDSETEHSQNSQNAVAFRTQNNLAQVYNTLKKRLPTSAYVVSTKRRATETAREDPKHDFSLFEE